MRIPSRRAASAVMTAIIACSLSTAALAERKVATSPTVTQHEIDSAQISLRLATEGMALLENKNAALPIARSGKVALFGAGAIQTIKGGTGSGAVNNRIVYADGKAVKGVAIASSVLDGFKNSGYEVITEDYLRAYDKANPTSAADMGRQTLAPEQQLTAADVAMYKGATDTAIYVVRRSSGEGADRTPTKGDYYLSDAELSNIKLLSEAFDKCVVVLNVISIDMSWYAASGADAVLLMGQAGELGGDALVQVLSGKVCPSGKLVDTWAKDYSDYPSSKYFAAINPEDPYSSFIEFYNEGIYVGYRYFDTFAPEKVAYPFGYGLSYTTFSIKTSSVEVDKKLVTAKVAVKNTGKTAGKEVVQLYFSAPAGTLDKPYQELAAYGKTDLLQPGESQTLTISFNTADMSSYSEARAAYIMEAGPYVIRVGNSSRNTTPAAVITLDKTVVVEQLTNQMAVDRAGTTPGGSAGGRGTPPYANKYKDVTVASNVASYNQLVKAFQSAGASGTRYNDGKSAGAAVKLSLAAKDIENAKSVYPPLAKGETYEDVKTYVSATTENADVKGFNYGNGKAYNVKPVYFDANGKAVDTKPAAMKNFRVKSGSEANGTATYYTLLDVYNGVLSMEQFVSGMTIEEMANFVEGGNKSPNADGQSAGGTSPSTQTLSKSAAKKIDDLFVRGEAGETCGLYIEDRLIPNTTNSDGPAGLRVSQSYDADGSTYYQFCTAYPVGTLIAQSWDTGIAYDMGSAIGAEMVQNGVTLWLAPGMNIHRNPLCGRNFEYYSEDPVIAGTMACAEGSGVQSNPGIGVTYKHFAGNNQETTRNASSNVVSERALREIYLKGFEIAVKGSKPMAIMTSYNINNSVPAANDYDMLENILRKEWGFDGMVMTDWGGSGGYSDARAMHAGNDIIMAGKTVANIIGYIADMAPAINYNKDGVATDGGYPYVAKTTRASGTTVTYTTVTHWGDYEPDPKGKSFAVATTSEAFAASTRPVRIYVDKQGVGYLIAPPAETPTTQELQQWSVKELLDGKTDSAGNLMPGMVKSGTASYVEADGKVTITYKLSKLSARDNVSSGHQAASTVDIFGDPDENTLTLGDLQKSTIRILNMVMASSQFADLTGVASVSYTKARANQLKEAEIVTKSKITK